MLKPPTSIDMTSSMIAEHCKLKTCTGEYCEHIKDTDTVLFSKNVYWHIIVANVISYHIVAGITRYIVKSCKGGLKLSTRTSPSPLRLLFFIALWASTNSNKQKKFLLHQHQVWHSWLLITFKYTEKQGNHSKAANQILQSCRPPLLRMLHSPSSFFCCWFFGIYTIVKRHFLCLCMPTGEVRAIILHV